LDPGTSYATVHELAKVSEYAAVLTVVVATVTKEFTTIAKVVPVQAAFEDK
jgi:hypothetical protein